jgi:hypothetical protein
VYRLICADDDVKPLRLIKDPFGFFDSLRLQGTILVLLLPSADAFASAVLV